LAKNTRLLTKGGWVQRTLSFSQECLRLKNNYFSQELLGSKNTQFIQEWLYIQKKKKYLF